MGLGKLSECVELGSPMASASQFMKCGSREAVSVGRIDAPGFFADPIITKAWARAEWHGPAPGQVDPVKEVQTAQMRVQNSFPTRERESIELIGSDSGKYRPVATRD